ncbi:MAG: hypothetical protein E2577_02065 [Starkeya sp.]|nr:hypothetical protein [Starkeya sp.]
MPRDADIFADPSTELSHAHEAPATRAGRAGWREAALARLIGALAIGNQKSGLSQPLGVVALQIATAAFELLDGIFQQWFKMVVGRIQQFGPQSSQQQT